MSRKLLTDCPKRPENAQPWNGYEVRSYSIQVVTPMFGGGVEPGELDPVTLIRASAIRGHLRFWWRATRGTACADTKELKQREVEIFGDTKNPSPVIVEVQAPKWEQRRLHKDDYEFGRFGPEAYALFSARHNEKDLCAEGFSFQLQIRWPQQAELQRRRAKENEQRRRQNQEPLPENIEDIAADVESALSTWINLGGLGARTRRGCGSLCVTSGCVDTDLTEVFEHVDLLTGTEVGTPLQAWRDAVNVYQEFRQSFRGKPHRKTLRSGKTINNIPGRSHWPEPDSIRQLTGCTLKPRPNEPSFDVPDDENPHDHSHPVVPIAALPSFPRAAFGLPIIFHFADGTAKDATAQPFRDPKDAELLPAVTDNVGRVIIDEQGKPKTHSRLASPIITRPVCVDGRWRPAIIILRRRYHLAAVLQGTKVNGRSESELQAIVSPQQIEGPVLGQLRPMLGKWSAIEALMEFAKSRGFKEVMQ